MKAAPIVVSLLVAMLAVATAQAEPSRCETLGPWSEPVNLGPPINTEALEGSATLSRNGLSLYFTSNRPGSLGGNDIWVSQRACADCPWEEPQHVPNINSAAADAGPSLSADGRLLFFHSSRPGSVVNPLNGQPSLDIWVSHRSDPTDDLGWGPPVNLGPDVNTGDGELMPEYAHQADFYLERERYPSNIAALYFGRGTGANPGNNQDIHVVPLSRDGRTLRPAVRVDELRSNANDAAPSLSIDQKEIYFWSGRVSPVGDIFVATRQNSHEPWSEPQYVTSINSPTAGDQQPQLSHSGRTLLFASNREGSVVNPATGLPSSDLWMSTRTPACD